MRLTLFLVGVVFTLFSCSEPKLASKPKIKDLTISVYAAATVQPEDYYLIYPTVPGILEEWFVEVGDSVKKGQLIAQIINDNSELQVESAELNAELASDKYKGQANMLKSIQTEIEATQKQVKIDSTNYARQANLWSKKIGSLAEFESAQLRYDLSKNRLLSLEQRLHQSQIELKNAYLQSQKNLKVAMTQLGDFGVKSIFDGKVFDISKKKGELVSIQQPMGAIGKADQFVIEMWVDEQDVSKIRVGQTFFITLDAYPGQAFEGRISKIYPQKNTQNQSFKLEGTFVKQPEKLFAGLSGEVNIILQKRKHVLTIPQSYLVNDSSVQTEAGLTNVQTGDRNLSEIEIISGIDSSTTIYTSAVNE